MGRARPSGLIRKRPGQHIKGEEREELAQALRKRYERGESIRQLAAYPPRSFGMVRNLLIESGVRLRPRGGRRKPRPVGVEVVNLPEKDQ